MILHHKSLQNSTCKLRIFHIYYKLTLHLPDMGSPTLSKDVFFFLQSIHLKLLDDTHYA